MVRAQAAALIRSRARSRAPGVGNRQARSEPIGLAAFAHITGRG
jgi:hypothetical protein